MNGLPSGRIAHHVSGRLRVVIEAARGHLDFLVKAAEQIQQLPGIDWVHTSPQTGSLIAHYDEDRGGMEEAIRELGLRARLFDLQLAPRAGRVRTRAHRRIGSHLGRKLIGWGRELDGNIKSATDGALDIRSLVPLFLAAASALARRKPGPTPLWITLAIFAFNSFDALNREVAPLEGEAFEVEV